MGGTVLDASALLAYLRDEPGAEVVADAVAEGTTISAVNLAEVLSRVADRGGDPIGVLGRMTAQGLLGGTIAVEPFTTTDAGEAARLRPLTRDRGLSLGDRACLALARRRDALALTADAVWSQADAAGRVQLIR